MPLAVHPLESINKMCDHLDHDNKVWLMFLSEIQFMVNIEWIFYQHFKNVWLLMFYGKYNLWFTSNGIVYQDLQRTAGKMMAKQAIYLTDIEWILPKILVHIILTILFLSTSGISTLTFPLIAFLNWDCFYFCCSSPRTTIIYFT
jgi:hypothetical protein